MRIELSDGEILEIRDQEVRALYATLLERTRQRGAVSAASKLRPALTWSSGAGTKVELDQFETEAVNAVRNDNRSAEGRSSATGEGVSARKNGSAEKCGQPADPHHDGRAQ
jgi:hypothetical protein